jgi:hypothetical protein
VPNRTFVRQDFRNLEALKVPASARGPERLFVVEGQQWLAYEAADRFTNTTTLIFIGPGTARRVREYPVNWRELSDIELYSLSWER